MPPSHATTRRTFLRRASLQVGGALLLGPTLTAAAGARHPFQHLTDPEAVSGLLFSQVGYDLGDKVRVVVRAPNDDALPTGVTCHLRLRDGEDVYQTALEPWGEQWHSFWWVAEFDDIDEPGTWDVEVRDGSNVRFAGRDLRVAKDVLWDRTHEWSSVDMLERRLHFTKVGAGWMDAGTLWVESPAQSAMIICLADMVREAPKKDLSQAFLERLYKQITVGADYLLLTQAKATELGFAAGAMSHDVLGHEKDILPNDVAKAVYALLRSAAALPDTEDYAEKKKNYLSAARLSHDWLLNTAKPLGDYGVTRIQRGLEEDVAFPKDEWPTRDLIFLCWNALEFWKLGGDGAQEQCLNTARQIMARQIGRDAAEGKYYGHFREFDSMAHSANGWVHSIGKNNYGADAGGLFPNYLMPLIELLEFQPDHPDAGRWRTTLDNFTTGYLEPACRANPFYLMPNGIFGEEGPVWFAGWFHGCNAIYGYTAALALRLSRLLDRPGLREIAVGNLQWIAGLNAGLTRESLVGCVVYHEDVPPGVAVPRSMICRIGNEWAGTWFNTKGVICNGFSVGKQFRHDATPTRANDGPFSFTDEDWIPHSAGWLTGLLYL